MQVVMYDTRGNTMESLTALRNELLKRFNHYLLVLQLPSLEGEFVKGYGLVILDYGPNPFNERVQEVIVIGNGFRGDGEGEGGAGHRAAQALLELLGLEAVICEPVSFRGQFTEETFRKLAQEIMLEGWRPTTPRLRPPSYIDHLFLEKGPHDSGMSFAEGR